MFPVFKLHTSTSFLHPCAAVTESFLRELFDALHWLLRAANSERWHVYWAMVKTRMYVANFAVRFQQGSLGVPELWALHVRLPGSRQSSGQLRSAPESIEM